MANPSRSSRTRVSPFQTFTSIVDKNQTVLQRSEPSSCAIFIGEQPNPWNLFQLQEMTSRHRGAKRFRRWGLSENISLLSPAYLLSVERWPILIEPPDHYDQLSFLREIYFLTVKRAFLPLNSTTRTFNLLFELTFVHLRYFFGGDPPSQTTNLAFLLIIN